MAADEPARSSRDPDPGAEDAAWRAIIAEFDQPVTTGQAPWPDDEDLPDDPGHPPAPGAAGTGRLSHPSTGLFAVTPAPIPVVPPPGPPPVDPAVADLDDADALDAHFVPELPAPIPRGDAVSRAAWGAVLGGPAFLLVAAGFSWQLQGWMVALAAAGFVGGFATLVARMKDRSDDEDDHGAVV
ncbi:MAG: hypothetical protein ACYCXA_09240 [Actinomycetes bacterium]